MNWLAENSASISRASIIVCLACVGFQTYRLFLWMRTEFESLQDNARLGREIFAIRRSGRIHFDGRS